MEQHPPRITVPHIHEDDDDDGLPFEKAMIAGAVAGVSEHLFMYPVDTIKTRMQAAVVPGAPAYSNVFQAMSHITRTEGMFRLYRGVGAILAGAIPSHAIYFATYETCKEKLGANTPGYHPVQNAIAGGMATMAHDAVVTPMDVIKQRLQVFGSKHSGVFSCARSLFQQSGLRGFYASYPTTVLMNIPFVSVNFATYESLKTFFSGPNGEHGPAQEIVAGGCAGALAGMVSNPLDVIKTRVQTQEPRPDGSRLSTRDIVSHIWKSEGLNGFLRGTQARMLYFVPSAAICWTTYETMKKLLA